MVEKIGTIKNPLTIIAIFAAIAEISGTVVLPFITDVNQGKYIWFLMLFPLLLVLLFFATLNFNHRVLYAPSDFKDEENFFKSFKPASPIEREEKLREHAREVAEEVLDTPITPEATPKPATPSTATARFSAQAKYFLAEELVLNKLAKEMGKPVGRNVSFGTSEAGRRFVFDGVIVDSNNVMAVEVKYIASSVNLRKRVIEVASRLTSIAAALPESTRSHFSLVLALVTDAPEEEHAKIASQAHTMIGMAPVPVTVRVFNLSQLEKEVTK